MMRFRKGTNKALDMQNRELLNTLMKWVNINTFTENISGLHKFRDELKSSFTPLECKIQEVALPDRTHLINDGKMSYSPTAPALLMEKHVNAPYQIYLGGHMDTVFPPTGAFQFAEIINDHIIEGPGIIDMKGGLMVMLKSLEKLENSPYAGRIGWKIVINPDEEVGSPASLDLIETTARNTSLGLLFEPAYHDGYLVNERKGSTNYTILARGIAAHSGRNFYEGKNAIKSMARVIMELQSLSHNNKELTINTGFIHGGGPVNIVPDRALCKINFRLPNSQDADRIEALLKKLSATIQEEEGVTITFHQDVMRYPKPYDKKNQLLFEAMKECASEISQELNWRASGGVCDGNILSKIGIPAIDSLGVIGGGMHTENEFIHVDSLDERINLVSHFLIKLARGDLKNLWGS